MHTQRGDTIIEVMIAIMILGAALGAGFAIANRSAQTTLDNQERFQGKLLAEQQIELLRKAAYDGTDGSRDNFIQTVNTLPGSFCMTETVPPALSSGTCTKTINIDYRVNIQPETIANPTSGVSEKSMFVVVVTWDGITGTTGRVELLYGI